MVIHVCDGLSLSLSACYLQQIEFSSVVQAGTSRQSRASLLRSEQPSRELRSAELQSESPHWHPAPKVPVRRITHLGMQSSGTKPEKVPSTEVPEP